ncbi:MAG: Hpt domain-containing protein, partial [Beijerinckiaceae bacterium]
MSAAIMSRDIDLVHLARQTAGDRGLEREVLALFRDQCVRMVAAIAQAKAEPPARTAAHTLKGAALGVGAYRVAEAAARCETVAEA